MKFYLRLYIAISWAGLIFALTATPIKGNFRYGVNPYDKLIHGFLFGVLSLLFALAIRERNNRSWTAIMISCIISFGYSALIEYIQFYIPGRTSSINDFLAGGAGILLVMATIYYVWRKKT
jgi:VanZ family protein